MLTGDDVVTDVQRALLHEHRGHRAAALVELGFDDRALGALVPGTGWTVVTEVEQGEARAASRAALYLTGAGVLLVGLLAIIRLAQHAEGVIFAPLEELRLGADRSGRGDLGHPIPLARADEEGRVAEAFNEMARRLKTHEDELAAQAAALTAEVLERKRVESVDCSYPGTQTVIQILQNGHQPSSGRSGGLYGHGTKARSAF